MAGRVRAVPVAYLRNGRYPALATVVRDGPHLTANQTVQTVLDDLLGGIEARSSS